MVTPVPNVYGEGGPASNPPAQEGIYPLSLPVLPALGGLTGLFSSPPFSTLPPPLGGLGGLFAGVPQLPTIQQQAFASCTVSSYNPTGVAGRGNWPADFGGSRLPQVLADP
jgi:hypothetical protein